MPRWRSLGKVVDFAAARDETAKEEKKALKQKPPTEKDKTAKPGRGRPPKDGKAAPDKAKPPKPRDKKSQSKVAPEKPVTDKGGAPAGAEVTPEPSAPRDATRAEKEEIVYLNLSDLHPFKNHPFGVRDDAEMQGLVESVKAAGVNQPALVRPREDGGYEIIAGHRRQRASLCRICRKWWARKNWRSPRRWRYHSSSPKIRSKKQSVHYRILRSYKDTLHGRSVGI